MSHSDAAADKKLIRSEMQKKFSVKKPARMGKSSSGNSMAKSMKPPKMNGKSAKGY